MPDYNDTSLIRRSDPTKEPFTISIQEIDGNKFPSVDERAETSDQTVVADKASTPLILVGDGVEDYGELIMENFIRLLEHFASPNPPLNAVEGTLWYKNKASDVTDTLKRGLYVYNGSKWHRLLTPTNMDEDLDFKGTFKILNYPDPKASGDLVNLKYVQSVLDNIASSSDSNGNITIKAGKNLIILGDGHIINPNLPTLESHVVNKKYVDQELTDVRDDVTRAAEASNQAAEYMSNISSTINAFIEDKTKSEITQQGGTFFGDVVVALSGSIRFVGAGAALNLGNRGIINVQDPAEPSDAATKNYVDSAVSGITTGKVDFDDMPSTIITNLSIKDRTIQAVASKYQDGVLVGEDVLIEIPSELPQITDQTVRTIVSTEQVDSGVIQTDLVEIMMNENRSEATLQDALDLISGSVASFDRQPITEIVALGIESNPLADTATDRNIPKFSKDIITKAKSSYSNAVIVNTTSGITQRTARRELWVGKKTVTSVGTKPSLFVLPVGMSYIVGRNNLTLKTGSDSVIARREITPQVISFYKNSTTDLTPIKPLELITGTGSVQNGGDYSKLQGANIVNLNDVKDAAAAATLKGQIKTAISGGYTSLATNTFVAQLDSIKQKYNTAMNAIKANIASVTPASTVWFTSDVFDLIFAHDLSRLELYSNLFAGRAEDSATVVSTYIQEDGGLILFDHLKDDNVEKLFIKKASVQNKTADLLFAYALERVAGQVRLKEYCVQKHNTTCITGLMSALKKAVEEEDSLLMSIEFMPIGLSIATYSRDTSSIKAPSNLGFLVARNTARKSNLIFEAPLLYNAELEVVQPSVTGEISGNAMSNAPTEFFYEEVGEIGKVSNVILLHRLDKISAATNSIKITNNRMF